MKRGIDVYNIYIKLYKYRYDIQHLLLYCSNCSILSYVYSYISNMYKCITMPVTWDITRVSRMTSTVSWGINR